MDTRFLDDLTPGQRFTSPGLTLTEAEIIDFAWRYDPQPFHLDANAAASSPYGGLIAGAARGYAAQRDRSARGAAVEFEAGSRHRPSEVSGGEPARRGGAGLHRQSPAAP